MASRWQRERIIRGCLTPARLDPVLAAFMHPADGTAEGVEQQLETRQQAVVDDVQTMKRLLFKFKNQLSRFEQYQRLDWLGRKLRVLLAAQPGSFLACVHRLCNSSSDGQQVKSSLASPQGLLLRVQLRELFAFVTTVREAILDASRSVEMLVITTAHLPFAMASLGFAGHFFQWCEDLIAQLLDFDQTLTQLSGIPYFDVNSRLQVLLPKQLSSLSSASRSLLHEATLLDLAFPVVLAQPEEASPPPVLVLPTSPLPSAQLVKKPPTLEERTAASISTARQRDSEKKKAVATGTSIKPIGGRKGLKIVSTAKTTTSSKASQTKEKFARQRLLKPGGLVIGMADDQEAGSSSSSSFVLPGHKKQKQKHKRQRT